MSIITTASTHDLGGLFKTTGFWYVAFLCLMFYAGVFPFLKFGVRKMVPNGNIAGIRPAKLASTPYLKIISLVANFRNGNTPA